MRDKLRNLLIAALALPSEEMAGLLGEVEEFKLKAMMRLATPALAKVSVYDELLDVEEAARRLGVTVDHLYRHSADYAFTRKIGGRLRFSTLGIEQFINEKPKVNGKRQ